jgi:hypothetical protein
MFFTIVGTVVTATGYRGPNQPDVWVGPSTRSTQCVADKTTIDRTSNLQIGLKSPSNSTLAVDIALGDFRRAVLLQPGSATRVAIENPTGDTLYMHCVYDDLFSSDVEVAIKDPNRAQS